MDTTPGYKRREGSKGGAMGIGFFKHQIGTLLDSKLVIDPQVHCGQNMHQIRQNFSICQFQIFEFFKKNLNLLKKILNFFFKF